MLIVRLIVILLLLVAVPLTVVRLFGLDRGFPFASLMTVFPYVALVAAAATVGAVLLGLRTEAVIGLATLVACGAVLVPRMLPGSAPSSAATGTELTVAVSNLRFGSGSSDHIVDALDAHDVDVLVVLELTEDSIARLEGSGLAERLAHSTLIPSRLTSGAGIYSRFPIRALAPSQQRPFGATPRALVDVTDHGTIEVAAVHPLPPINREWTSLWEEALASLPGPATASDDSELRLLAGDFNATHDHGAFRALLERGWVDAADARGAGLRPTFNGLPFGDPVPPVTLDHVLVDERVAVEHVAVHPLARSDHRILVARLRLPGR